LNKPNGTGLPLSISVFNWGLQGTNGGRLQELKTEIDKGNPVPLGLFKPGDGGAGPHHQVLAIGYKGGRYKGDLGAYKEDLEILVYDPNYPGVTRTLKPKPSANIYYYKEDPNNTRCQWQTYFVNKKYNYNKPPEVQNPLVSTDGLVREILLEARTGGDDLRGGNDNLNVTVYFKDGKSQVFNNVNKSARWIGNYTETVPLRLTTPVPLNQLKSIKLNTKFGGGIGGDNWNLEGLRVIANDLELVSKSGTPLIRFTGSVHDYSAAFTINETADGKIRELIFEISTGGDDLRGGNDNLNVTVMYKDGSKYTKNNINKSTGWGGGSNAYVNVPLNKYVPVTEIKSIILTTTFGGGMGGDNWNMDRLRICARGGGVYKEIFLKEGGPVKRFTGSDKTFIATAVTE
jgi:hypothetical protein